MKYQLLGLLVISLLWACASPNMDLETMSTEELRSEIEKKKQEIAALQSSIQEMEVLLKEKDTSKVEEGIIVTVDTVTRATFIHTVDVQANVESEDQVNATAEMGGSITKLFVREGQKVRSGELIASIDITTLNSQKAELENQLRLAQQLFEKQKSLWERKIGSEVQFLEAKNRVENLENSISTLETNISNGKVYAPQYGIIEVVYVKQGEYVGPGSPIVSIINNKDLKVVADIPEKYLPNISEGQKISIRFPNLGVSQESNITLIGATIDPNNRTFKIEAPISIRDNNNLIKPNLLAIIELVDYQKDDIIYLPSHLVQQKVMGGSYVLVAEKDSLGHYVSIKKEIQPGKYFNDVVIVESGISEGDLIIETGARGLSEDVKLKVISDEEASVLLSQSNK